jgi:alpha-1,3-rhamnosyltransferase
MSSNPLVSVVVVSYNHSRYIKENLDSIRKQTYSNVELIIADDASQDNSVEIIENWLKENNLSAKKNFHKVNTGLATVLNECTEMATGKYIKLIAADDYLHQNYLDKTVSKLEELGDEYGMVFTDTFAFDDLANKITDFVDYNLLYGGDALQFRKKILEYNKIAALTVLMRTSVLIETGPYESKYIVEDYHRWLMINEIYLIAYVPEKLSFYRFHANNISSKEATRIKEEALELQMLFDKEGIYRVRILHSLAQIYALKREITPHLFNIYNSYIGKSNLLIKIIRYKFPVKIYYILKRILRLS